MSELIVSIVIGMIAGAIGSIIRLIQTHYNFRKSFGTAHRWTLKQHQFLGLTRMSYVCENCGKIIPSPSNGSTPGKYTKVVWNYPSYQQDPDPFGSIGPLLTCDEHSLRQVIDS